MDNKIFKLVCGSALVLGMFASDADGLRLRGTSMQSAHDDQSRLERAKIEVPQKELSLRDAMRYDQLKKEYEKEAKKIVDKYNQLAADIESAFEKDKAAIEKKYNGEKTLEQKRCDAEVAMSEAKYQLQAAQLLLDQSTELEALHDKYQRVMMPLKKQIKANDKWLVFEEKLNKTVEEDELVSAVAQFSQPKFRNDFVVEFSQISGVEVVLQTLLSKFNDDVFVREFAMLNLSIGTYNNNATTFGQDLINKMYDISNYLKGKLPPQTTDKVADVLTLYIDSYPAEACLFKLLCDNGVLGTTLPTVFPHIAKLVDTRLMDVVSNFKFEEQKESEEESESDDLESVDSKLG